MKKPILELELTWLRDHVGPYDLGDEEFHLAFRPDDFEAAHKKHREMGCICLENPQMGIYFIQDRTDIGWKSCRRKNKKRIFSLFSPAQKERGIPHKK